MKAETTTAAQQTLPQDIHLVVGISKVDKETRIVRGVATAEVVDSDGEVIDYETAKSVLSAWHGNIREMHQPVAVGKRVAMEFDDVNKQIIVDSYVSKGAPATWEKVLDGTLSMYSIGARGVKKVDKVGNQDVKRVFLTKMSELSLVDNGACPTSHFSVVKMDGEQPIDDQPADPVPVDRALLKTMVLGTQGVATQLLAAIDAGGLAVDIQKRVESYDVQNALRAISCIEELVASEMWQTTNASFDGGAPDADGPAQLAMLKSAAELLLAFLISEFMSQFEEPATDGAAVTPEAATVENMRKAFGGVDFAALATNVMKVGKRHSKTDEELIQQMHDSAITLGAVCKAAEAAADEETEEEKLAKAAAAAAPATPPAPAAGADDRITKLTTDLTTATSALTDAKETIQKQQGLISDIEKRMKALEDSPAPGGPKARVVPVQKTIGAPDAEAATATDAAGDEVMKAFDTLAAAAKTDEQRAELAIQKLAYMNATGANAVDPRSGRALAQ